MSNFQAPPTTTLATKADLLNAINQPETWAGDYHASRIKSEWLCAIIAARESAGHGMYIDRTIDYITAPDTADRIDHTELTHPEAWRHLEYLVFMANAYVRDARFRADGYQPFTQELVMLAYTTGAMIEVNHKLTKPTKHGDAWITRPPRARTTGYMPDYDTPVRLVYPAPTAPIIGTLPMLMETT